MGKEEGEEGGRAQRSVVEISTEGCEEGFGEGRWGGGGVERESRVCLRSGRRL